MRRLALTKTADLVIGGLETRARNSETNMAKRLGFLFSTLSSAQQEIREQGTSLRGWELAENWPRGCICSAEISLIHNISRDVNGEA
ncbi:hypothetical protein RRG08_050567 [Elysia crispata]|uniref:Uncharacterized protein n=1 Tax=Elysia crispata TaxID=231223 RepID=A0AAE1DAV6_9GAST|nr:hypothetical protein RRG08_050567 [Elysia crispata]